MDCFTEALCLYLFSTIRKPETLRKKLIFRGMIQPLFKEKGIFT